MSDFSGIGPIDKQRVYYFISIFVLTSKMLRHMSGNT